MKPHHPFNSYGEGRLRRLIYLHCDSQQFAVGWMEDDFHHFGVMVKHDGKKVIDIHMEAARYPWETCPGAAQPLKALIGQPLIPRASDIGKLLEMRQQCTHVFDLTGLVLAQAFKRRPRRRYEAIIPDREIVEQKELLSPIFGPGTASLKLNNRDVLEWGLEGDCIISPACHAGQTLNKGFRGWSETLDEDTAEYATILRRSILVAGGRSINHDNLPNAAYNSAIALCHSFQPERSHMAWRVIGSTRDHSTSSRGMLARVRQQP